MPLTPFSEALHVGLGIYTVPHKHESDAEFLDFIIPWLVVEE